MEVVIEKEKTKRKKKGGREGIKKENEEKTKKWEKGVSGGWYEN